MIWMKVLSRKSSEVYENGVEWIREYVASISA